MRFKCLRSYLIVSVMFLIFCPVWTCAQDSNIAVTVVGSGSSIDEARQDAVRQALQLTIKQLVVVDRFISGDKVVRDKVMSTMNGYVDSFNEVKIAKNDAGQYLVTAEIKISGSRIENFLAIPTGVGGEIEGSALLAEQNRRKAQARAEELQAKARGEIFDRVWRGFPAAAMDIKVLSVGLSKHNDNLIEVKLRYTYKTTFIKMLKDTLDALSVHTCERNYYNQCGSNGYASGLPSMSIYELNYEFWKIYYLAPGAYCSSCLDITNNNMKGTVTFIVTGRFVDATGMSVMLGGQECIVKRVPMNGPFINWYIGIHEEEPVNQWRRDNTKPNWSFHGALEILPREGVLVVPTSLVDLSRVKYFVAVGGFSTSICPWDAPPNSYSMFTNIVPDVASQSQDGCVLLDEAIQHQLMENQRPLLP